MNTIIHMKPEALAEVQKAGYNYKIMVDHEYGDLIDEIDVYVDYPIEDLGLMIGLDPDEEMIKDLGLTYDLVNCIEAYDENDYAEEYALANAY